MKGFLIKYMPYMAKDRTRLNHVLFGRILTLTRRGKKYAYYTPGLLDNILFIRIGASLIFVQDISSINLEDIRIFGDVDITPCEREMSLDMLYNGRDYWYNVAKEKNVTLKERRGKRK